MSKYNYINQFKIVRDNSDIATNQRNDYFEDNSREAPGAGNGEHYSAVWEKEQERLSDFRSRRSFKPAAIKRMKRRRLAMPQPPPGQPGGFGDPLKKGLSGAGVRWYMRFLAQGLKPEEARKKAEEKKTNSEPEGDAAYMQSTTNEGMIFNDAKRLNADTNTARAKSTIDATTSMKRKLTTDDTTSASGVVRVAILPRHYPEDALTADEASTLEEAIMDEVALGWEAKLKFEGTQCQLGMLLVDCVNKETADWLGLVAPKLNSWDGVDLMACLENDIPEVQTITTYLPKSVGQDRKKSLALIDAQNEGLHTSQWKIVSCIEDGKGQLITIVVDDESLKTIENQDHTLQYKFGTITIHGPKKNLGYEKISKYKYQLRQPTNQSW